MYNRDIRTSENVRISGCEFAQADLGATVVLGLVVMVVLGLVVMVVLGLVVVMVAWDPVVWGLVGLGRVVWDRVVWDLRTTHVRRKMVWPSFRERGHGERWVIPGGGVGPRTQ